ncbi:uncharacterized protein [Amphiura filiformis]|uniref:uncharacterized protein n=1 Tax=Amphiura filiformis TaxID=82378 RepID=UPI003B21CB74
MPSLGFLKDLYALVLYLFDVGSDIAVGVLYIMDGDTWWGSVTLTFAVVALVLTNIIVVKQPIYSSARYGGSSQRKKVFRVFATLQLGMLYVLLYKFIKRRQYDSYDVQVNVVRLIEAFVESAPQLVLQLYIMTQMTSVKWLTVVSVVFSVSSLMWVSRSTYALTIQPLRSKHTRPRLEGYRLLAAHVCLSAWLLLTIFPTAISMALFASYYTWRIVPVVTVYYVMNMIERAMLQRTEWTWVEFFHLLMYSFPSMFITWLFISTTRDSLTSVLVFLCTQFIANTSMFLPWFVAGGYDTWYGIPVAVVVWCGYIAGIVFMVILFHITGENDKLKPQLPCLCCLSSHDSVCLHTGEQQANSVINGIVDFTKDKSESAPIQEQEKHPVTSGEVVTAKPESESVHKREQGEHPITSGEVETTQSDSESVHTREQEEHPVTSGEIETTQSESESVHTREQEEHPVTSGEVETTQSKSESAHTREQEKHPVTSGEVETRQSESEAVHTRQQEKHTVTNGEVETTQSESESVQTRQQEEHPVTRGEVETIKSESKPVQPVNVVQTTKSDSESVYIGVV